MTQSELKSKLEKALEFYKSEISQIRTGRANPSLLENIESDAYGSKMKIKELGSITMMDAQNIMVTPWDKSLLNTIANSIRNSDLHLNPAVEQDKLRVPVPPLTEERRKEFTKIVTAKSEDAKNVVRNIRQDAMKDIDKDFNEKTIGEDEKFTKKEEAEKIVKEYVTKIDELAESKKSDLMSL